MHTGKFLNLAGLLAALTILPGTAMAAEEAATTPTVSDAAKAAPQSRYKKQLAQWHAAQALLKKMEDAVGQDGVMGLAAFTTSADAALKDIGKGNVIFDPASGKAWVLVSGGGELVTAPTYLQKELHAKIVKTVRSPYPVIALYMGSYYNEVKQPENALGDLNTALRLSDRFIRKIGSCAIDGYLLSEKAIALLGLHRLPEALKTYDEGLKVAEDKKDASMEGRMDRGRGNILTEMGKLDQAEAAYQASLKVDPDNKIALHELKYIAGLKANAPKAPVSIVIPGTFVSAKAN